MEPLVSFKYDSQHVPERGVILININLACFTYPGNINVALKLFFLIVIMVHNYGIFL